GRGTLRDRRRAGTGSVVQPRSGRGAGPGNLSAGSTAPLPSRFFLAPDVFASGFAIPGVSLLRTHCSGASRRAGVSSPGSRKDSDAMKAALAGALALLCAGSATAATVTGTVNYRDTRTAACPNPSTGCVTSRRRGMVGHQADHPRPITDGAGRRAPRL